MALKSSQMNDLSADLLTPAEVAKRLQVTAEQVRSLIRKGDLAAINVGTGEKRPLYRITSQALETFISGRWQAGPAVKPRQFKRLQRVTDHFSKVR